MNIHQKSTAILVAAALIAFAPRGDAQCTEITSGLRTPLSSVLTSQGNLLISETGVLPTLNSGRLSILGPNGQRRTLIDGLPSAQADVPEPSGPAGLVMRGRTLYLAIGTGNVGIAGPRPGTTLVNPNGPSSPLFSSILMIHLSAAAEKNTAGYTLTAADQQALANGQTVRLSRRGGDKITIQMIADFPNFIPFPLPGVPNNIQISNPFDLVVEGRSLYVTDGGRNLVWEVDLASGAVSELVNFPAIPNPVFPAVGGPTLQAVPTGIASHDGQLLVTLFRGAPFPPGTSTVEAIDVVTGTSSPFITGLKTAIDILPITTRGETSYLVLQHASQGLFFGSPGQVLRFDDPAGAPTVLASCLTRPTSMTLDEKRGVLYVTEVRGRLVSIPIDL